MLQCVRLEAGGAVEISLRALTRAAGGYGPSHFGGRRSGRIMEEGVGFQLSAERQDEPPNSRVFLVLGKDTSEALIRDRFARFGEIQRVWLVRDKRTRESKGIAFVKFARSSQACRAMEEMHGQSLAADTKPIKAFIAQSRASGSHRDLEYEELTRIFVMIPKSYTEEELRDKFKIYGDVEYCSVIRNRATGESKAALAIEECDRSYRAILADPKNKSSESFEHEYSAGSTRQEPMGQPEFCSLEKNETRGREVISKRLSVISRLPFVQEQIFSLFDLVPGLEYCDTQRDVFSNQGHAVIQYSSAASAVYAKHKLHGFEYPPGNRLIVIFLEDGTDGSDLIRKMATQVVTAQVSSMMWNNNPVGQQYMASPVYGRRSSSPLTPLQTDAILPSCRRKASLEASTKERLFVVFNPYPLHMDILDDLFCRFGHLIEVYLVAGKNVGYVKFADRTSASDAIAALHGKTVNGVRLKVMLADSPREESNKRQRTH
uniref:RNA binding motif protein 45 n=1 Tax=Sphenodon punctatus TaxID=8508 RepID=A0A8D0GNF2_SPHPU